VSTSGAAEHFRASQQTRAEILGTFWPQANIDPNKAPHTLPINSFSLGDARYSIARRLAIRLLVALRRMGATFWPLFK
jgi:hypothetical protein